MYQCNEIFKLCVIQKLTVSKRSTSYLHLMPYFVVEPAEKKQPLKATSVYM